MLCVFCCQFSTVISYDPSWQIAAVIKTKKVTTKLKNEMKVFWVNMLLNILLPTTRKSFQYVSGHIDTLY